MVALLIFPAAANADMKPSRCSAPGVTDQYDALFERAAKKYLRPGFSWCLLKAQAMAESGLDPNAVSPAHAIGLLQVLPSTGKWTAKRYGGKLRAANELKNARVNIRIASQYLSYLRRFWSYPRPEFCRTKLAWASYNAGPGNVVRGQELSGGRLCWPDISPFMHEVTGRHSAETLAYVHRILQNYLRLKGLVP